VPPLRLQASYLLSDARVEEFPADPTIEDNWLPQVPRNRVSLRLDYLNPRLLNVSLQGRYEGSRFDDDRNELPLDSLFVVDLSLDRPLGDTFGAFLSVQNLFDYRYAVQVTPVELQGLPITVTAGLRLELGPR
jgi:outer membrane receptor protein involved in Fe transport